MTPTRCAFLFLALIVTVITGCSGGNTTSVHGKVTLDGQPLASGEIVFDAEDGTVPTPLTISGGSYSGKVPVGKKTVRINSYQAAPAKSKVGGPGADQPGMENVIPAQYNANSKESRDVAAGAANEFNFDLKTAK